MLARLWLIAVLLLPAFAGVAGARTGAGWAGLPAAGEGCGAACCCEPNACPCITSREEDAPATPAVPPRTGGVERFLPPVADGVDLRFGPMTRVVYPAPAFERPHPLAVRTQALLCIWLT